MIEVSVIVPAHNAADTLAAAISSVQGQGLRAIEILIVDDASRDRTYEIALSIARADPRVRVIRRATNGGPSGARNSGLEAAKGTWVALLDADDLYLPQRLSVLTDAARSAGCDLVADNLILQCPESDRCLGLAMAPGSLNSGRLLTAAEFARNDRPFPGGFGQFGYLKPLVRRAFLDQHQLRYDSDIWVAEDFVFYMRCLLAGARMILLPDAYYQYLLSTDSITRSGIDQSRNFEHFALGNARILDQAQRQGDRATIREMKRRGRSIAFLRACHGYKSAVKRHRRAEAIAHLVRMPLAPVDLACHVKLSIAARVARAAPQ
jgi:glycosyltransferase involved in cell wall biosynthesis